MGATVKSFGVVNAPGTQVIEKPGAAVLQPSALGGSVFMGPFTRGMVSTFASPKLNRCPTKRTFDRKMGGRLAGYVTPDAVQDFFEYGSGAGAVYAVRLTDGTEEQSEVILYSRHWGTARLAPESSKDNQSQVKYQVLKIKAKNGGRWGGRKRIYSGAYSISGDLTATTLTTGVTMLENEWAGAELSFVGITGKTYEVVSNTTAGVLTVRSSSDMAADYAAASASSKVFKLSLGNLSLTTGGRQALAVKVVPALVDPDNNFGLHIIVDNQIVARYDDVSMDPSSEFYISTLVSARNASDNNDEIEVEDLAASLGFQYVPDLRPANFYAMPKTVAATRATFLPGTVKSISDSGIRIASIGGTSVPAVPHRLTFTWNSSTNLYTVVATEIANGVKIANLADFSVGNGAQYNQTWTPGATVPSVTLTLDHDTEPANGATIVIDVLPVDATMVDGEIYPAAKTSTVSSLRVTGVSSDGSNYLDITSGDLTALGLGPAQASVTGSAAETFAITSGVNDKLKFSIDGRTSVTVTLTAGGTQAASDIVTDINDAFDAIFGAGVLNPASETADNKVKLTSAWYEGGGPGSSIAIETVANDAYTALGFTVGTTRGTAGREMAVSYRQECTGGHDGGAPADAKYLDAMDNAQTPLKVLDGQAAGVLMVATPDKTSTAVQQRAQAFCETKNHVYFVQVPSGTVTEQGAIDYITGTVGYGDHSVTLFPSYGYVRDPDKSGPLKLVSLSGALFGLMAKFAQANQMYAAPPAGVEAKLHRVVSLPTGDEPVNLELLTPKKINGLKKRGAGWVVWGMQALATSSTAVREWSNRMQLSHYEHWLLDNLDWVIFRLNDPDLWYQVQSELTTYFTTEWRGGKGPLFGDSPEKAFQIKIDEELNTAATIAQNELLAEINLVLKHPVQKFQIGLSRDAVSEVSG